MCSVSTATESVTGPFSHDTMHLIYDGKKSQEFPCQLSSDNPDFYKNALISMSQIIIWL